MNVINNESELILSSTSKNSHEILEMFYISIGSTSTIDSLYMYLVLSLGSICFGLNFLSFLAFLKINFRKRSLKHFLIIYTLSGWIIAILSIVSALSRIPRYSNIAFYFISNLYRCKFNTFGTNLYLFMIILDCILLLERISNFQEKLKIVFKKIN
jgi:hypothetical protein